MGVLVCGCEIVFWSDGRICTDGGVGGFGCEGEGVTTGWTELYSEEFLYCSAGIEVNMRGRECSILGWRSEVWKTLVVNGEWKSTCGRRRC
jgi:hypothetical protein